MFAMDEKVEKAAIRREMRRLRKAVAPAERAAAAQTVCASLLSRQDVVRAIGAAKPIAVYLASPSEIDLSGFIAAVLRGGGRVVAPRWNGADYELAEVVSLSDESLRRGPMGILEPTDGAALCAVRDVAVWLIPGLAFTRSGLRLGYGGGWYDRLLASAAPDSSRLGIAYGFQVVETLPTEPHDRRMTDVVSAGEMSA